MNHDLSEAEMQAAIDRCADEPVHIPGTIQPIGYLLGCGASDGTIRYASENCAEVFARPLSEILGQNLGALMGRDVWHSIANVRSFGEIEKRHFASIWNTAEKTFAVHCAIRDDTVVVEIEDTTEAQPTSPEVMRQQAMLIEQIDGCSDADELFDLTVQLLRHVTGFDRVKVIEFDHAWNGHVRAEARSPLVPTMMGLRFPHTDIPPQARDLMAKIPLRLIADVNQVPIPIVALDPATPLDITFANSRGVSAVHMQYLQNMDIGATMTLSIVLDGKLWGYISFHHRRPFVASTDIRHILLSFLPVLRLKLHLILRNAALDIAKSVDKLQSIVQHELEGDTALENILTHVGPAIINVLDATGVVMTSGSQTYTYGKVPDASVIAALPEQAEHQPNRTLATDCLAETLPALAARLDGFAGALVTLHEGGRSLQVFREEIQQTVSWAGDPEKKAEVVEGNYRLEPRRSFSAYLQEVEGRCKAWSLEEIHVMRQLWPLLGAAERRAFQADLNRQQALMINELNHRVRNILALVKSVSTQARRSDSSLESYSNALEARIRALAAAHDIGAGAARTSVSILEIVEMEAEPFDSEPGQRVRTSGDDAHIQAETAPIFALVIHEMMTNAVKYGALSGTGGTVDVAIERRPDGVQLTWTETGGPAPKEPESRGFGTTLIAQAIPYELGGTSDIEFGPEGVIVRLFVPESRLAEGPRKHRRAPEKRTDSLRARNAEIRDGLVLVLEDNFMIAQDMRSALKDAGFTKVETASSATAALELLEGTTPGLAVLDVNLGGGETSERVAMELVDRHVPVLFVTGYGEKFAPSPQLRNVPVLTKPIATSDLITTVNALIE